MPQPDINRLFELTLESAYEDDTPWEAVHELRRLGTQEVFDLAKEWCGSTEPLRRAMGLDVLAQLGKTAEHPHNTFPEESYSLITSLVVEENEPRPLASAVFALGHLGESRAVPLIAKLQTHPNSEIRFSVACALGNFPDEPVSVAALMRLMRDEHEDVRDWATFGLGVLGKQDSPTIREAFVSVLNDSHDGVREEALLGLAKRGDVRAIPALLEALNHGSATELNIEAAYTMLGYEKEPEAWTIEDYSQALKQRFGLREE
jgi:HEAT repeat protein